MSRVRMVQNKDWGEVALSTAQATSCVVKSESSLTPDHTNSKKNWCRRRFKKKKHNFQILQISKYVKIFWKTKANSQNVFKCPWITNKKLAELVENTVQMQLLHPCMPEPAQPRRKVLSKNRKSILFWNIPQS